MENNLEEVIRKLFELQKLQEQDNKLFLRWLIALTIISVVALIKNY